MDIEKYNGKRILLIDIDNQEFKGIGKYVTSGDNEDLGEALIVYANSKWVQFSPDEIKSIKIIK